jgi:hypothetical protein
MLVIDVDVDVAPSVVAPIPALQPARRDAAATPKAIALAVLTIFTKCSLQLCIGGGDGCG